MSTHVSAQRELLLETTTLTEREVAIGLDVPWEMKWGPDDYIWLTERPGRMKRIKPRTGNVTEILDLTNIVGNFAESGMLGFCFHPDFQNNQRLFLAYDIGNNENNLTKRLSAFRWDGTQLVDEQILLENIRAFQFHSGCRLLISRDDKLLMTLGDIFNEELPQDKNSLHGKLLRINLDGSVPSDNPIPNSYIYAYGLRNSQGLAYGPQDRLYISEHGPDSADEFNQVVAGANYGWPNVLGQCNTGPEIAFCNANNVQEPLIEWTPPVAPSDIIYYNHEAIPEWEGQMLMAMLGGFFARFSGIRFIDLNEAGTTVLNSSEVFFRDYGRIRDICINPNNGAIYFATNGSAYPSQGPNRIIEYRNLDFISTVIDEPDVDQYFNVFPSPVKHGQALSIDYSSSFNNTVAEIYSMNGEFIQTISINRQKGIATDEFEAGQYFIKVANGKGTITQKFIVIQ